MNVIISLSWLREKAISIIKGDTGPFLYGLPQHEEERIVRNSGYTQQLLANQVQLLDTNRQKQLNDTRQLTEESLLQTPGMRPAFTAIVAPLAEKGETNKHIQFIKDIRMSFNNVGLKAAKYAADHWRDTIVKEVASTYYQNLTQEQRIWAWFYETASWDGIRPFPQEVGAPVDILEAEVPLQEPWEEYHHPDF